MREAQGRKLFAEIKVLEWGYSPQPEASPLKPACVMSAKASSLSLSTLSVANAEPDGAAGKGTEVKAPVFV